MVIKAEAMRPMKMPASLPFMPGLVVPGLAENLLLIGQLADRGVTSVFTKDKVEFYKSPVTLHGEKCGEGQRINRKYLVRPLTALSASTSPASLLTWHLRPSHCGTPKSTRALRQS